jgi:hypothetical protein
MPSKTPQDQHDDDNEDVIIGEPYTPQDVSDAVTDIFEEHGYITTEGARGRRRNFSAIVHVIYPPISEALVMQMKERASKMVTRGTLTAIAFPNLPDESDLSGYDNPDLMKAVIKSIDSKVWNLTALDHSGQVQQMLGMKTNLVLCRVRIKPVGGNDAVDGVYVTENYGCIVADNFGPDEKRFIKLAQNIGKNRGMVTIRQPAYADQINKGLKATMILALESGANALKPAIEAAHAQTDNEDNE